MGQGYTHSGVGADSSAPTEGQVISCMFVIGFKIWTVIYFHLPYIDSTSLKRVDFQKTNIYCPVFTKTDAVVPILNSTPSGSLSRCIRTGIR